MEKKKSENFAKIFFDETPDNSDSGSILTKIHEDSMENDSFFQNTSKKPSKFSSQKKSILKNEKIEDKENDCN